MTKENVLHDNKTEIMVATTEALMVREILSSPDIKHILGGLARMQTSLPHNLSHSWKAKFCNFKRQKYYSNRDNKHEKQMLSDY